MDTEEDIEIRKSSQEGHSHKDEGPYYYESWWGSYKASVKGKLGGVIIGALLGAAVGGVAAIGLAAVVAEIAVLPLIAGFAAAGMIYGAHEFGDIGKIVGSDAETAEKLESRMKSFEKGKFSELKQEMREIKAMLKGEKLPAPEIHEDDDSYRTKHLKDLPPDAPRKWVFWNIAGIGLAVGAVAGGLLALGGFDTMLLHHLGGAGHALEGMGHLATVAATGLFGASFGINRDIFKQVFDKTDLLFKGLTKDEPAKEKVQAIEKPVYPVTTIVYEHAEEHTRCDTYHRDKVLASAKQALLSMDHTKSIPH